VTLSVRPGPCILVSGHDMADMDALLQATEGKGINGEPLGNGGARRRPFEAGVRHHSVTESLWLAAMKGCSPAGVLGWRRPGT
jgi:hypothetical protein